jgi:hypothetical protein
MADQILEDKQGRIIAKISTGSSGIQTITDPQGRTKGSYDPRTNKTRDPQGRTVGIGNLLTTLL